MERSQPGAGSVGKDNFLCSYEELPAQDRDWACFKMVHMPAHEH